MIQFNNSVYVLNLEKITEFFVKPVNVANEIEILETFEPMNETNSTQMLVNKQIREIKNQTSQSAETLKYDLFKTILNNFFEYTFNIDENINTMPLGLNVCINTLIKYGFLEEIKNN